MVDKSRLPSPQPQAVNGLGLLYGVLAYGLWGILPVYWKLLSSLSPLDILSHRLIWSAVFLGGLLMARRQMGEVLGLVRSPRQLLALLGTALLLAANWGIYIYGVNIDRVVETSLGYFINPLINVLLGCVVLRERLTPLQGLAVGFATLGVINFVARLGAVPWIAFAVALSFALYGLGRKLLAVSPLLGIFMETLLLSPLAIVWLGHAANPNLGQGEPGQPWSLTLLLLGSGVVTSIPLLCFNKAAKLLPLSNLGFLQYIAPCLQLMLGVFLYGEPFTQAHLVSFGWIWLALGVYSLYLWRLHDRFGP